MPALTFLVFEIVQKMFRRKKVSEKLKLFLVMFKFAEKEEVIHYNESVISLLEIHVNFHDRLVCVHCSLAAQIVVKLPLFFFS